MALRKIVSPKTGKASWQIDYLDPNKKRVRVTFKTKKEATAELGKRQSLMVEKRYLDVKKEYKTRLKELLAKYKENFQDQASYKGVKRFYVDNIGEYFGEETLLGNINYVDLETYRNHLKLKLTIHDKIRKPATINREMACLRHIMSKAVEWDIIERDPFKKGKSLHLKENNKRLRFLSEDEITRLLNACPPYLRNVVACAVNTGMRRGEMLSLKWDQVRNGLIYLNKTKTNEARQIPINDALNAVFKEIRKKQQLKSKHVFTYQGKRITDSVRVPFNTSMKRAGIVGFRFHDLRHTFASQLILHGGDLKDVQELLGHKSMTMTLRYAHLTQEHKKKAVNLLNKLTDHHKMSVRKVSEIKKT